MKKASLITVFIIFTLSVISFVACNKDEDGNESITVNGEAAVSLTMNAEGDSKTVVVRGIEAWTAESTSWITVYPTSGAANTDVTVTISVGANNSEERLGSAVFTLPTSEFVDVLVVQPAMASN
ncbi:MAG: hypothetical protein LBQ22_04945 [Bacteroidales bacterium]|jgi:hypothetical protein|nr:hypothetical protein [Bacteroidales bacterium]